MNKRVESVTGNLSMVRILEVIASAAIVGSIAVYSSHKVNEERLNTFTDIVKQNSHTLANLEKNSIELRIEMARTESNDIIIKQLAELIDRHEKNFDTIWPRMRDLASRVDRIETKLGLERRVRETEIPLK